ncbi:hypothetical protein LENED_001410 [Lentinula edodes]|uniref:Uncharacterized protein n=1 Tax=Lentinula edodes TaxID=5353 RepID=A0A1Q3DY46_LENED|nr:hypothetical protein LENED_001410 [Lentinula edodes]
MPFDWQLNGVMKSASRQTNLNPSHGAQGSPCDAARYSFNYKAHTLPKDSETCTSNKAVQLEVGQLLVERILHPD